MWWDSVRIDIHQQTICMLMKKLSGYNRIQLAIVLALMVVASMASGQDSTIHVKGSHILAPNGERIIFRGVNKMVFYHDLECDCE